MLGITIFVCSLWIASIDAGCKVQYSPGVFFRCCRLDKYWTTNSVEQCVAQCTGHNSKKQPHEYWCLRVNWNRQTGECSLLYTTTTSMNDPSMQMAHSEYMSATLVECDSSDAAVTTARPWQPAQPSQPKGVGCGMQASQFQPYIPSKRTTTRIIGGTQAVPHSWPWQVSLRTSAPGMDWHFCGGTLVRVREDLEESDMILTAAHCVSADPKVGLGNMTQWTVIVGGHTRSQKYMPGEERRRVVDFKYPNEFKELVNDVALIRMDRPVRFSDTVRPVCLPAQNEPVPVGRLCMASGWGRNHSTETTQQDELKQALTPVHSIEYCQRNWYYQQQAWSYAFLCAGALDASSATCSGDSGGPVMCKNNDGSWTQFGVASYVPPKGCATANMPPVFSRIPTYSSWLKQTIASMSGLMKG